MQIVFTHHARKKIHERGVDRIWIEETIKFPDEIRRNGNKWYVVKKLNGKTLKVVYVKETYIKVITFYWQR